MERPFFSKTLLVEDQALTGQAMKTLLLQCEPRLQVDETGDYSGCIALLGSRQYDLLFSTTTWVRAVPGSTCCAGSPDRKSPCTR